MELFQGVWVALVTPFADGKIDKDALRKLVHNLVEAGISGFVPLGTTGEASCLSPDERRDVIKIVLDAAGHVPVVPGCGTNNTQQSIDNVRMARDLGAHGAMVITPYYNKPTQKGLIAHFTAIAEATDLNLMLYNVPGRTSVNMLPATVAELADHPRIAALKEASGNLEQISEICDRVDGKLKVLSGDDALTLPIMAVGATGVVSVTGQVLPKPLVKMVAHALAGEFDKALPLHRALLPLHKAMFIETSPGPVKCALHLQKRIQNELRLPMIPVSDESRKRIAEVLAQAEKAEALQS